MTCPDCTKSATEVWHGFHASCKGCAARAAARSPQFRNARFSGKQFRGYLALLDQYGVTHEEVKAAHAADFEAKVQV